jgi:NAD(P)-dependent dehydrogenase (short-subunit alcohol dehydrogenase family)
VVGLTKVAALEYATRGIRVNAVCPGVIDTPMVERVIERLPAFQQRALESEPIGRFGRPEEIAAAVVWLSSDAAAFLTGVALPVDGGFVAR